jgi:hypothetical protein
MEAFPRRSLLTNAANIHDASTSVGAPEAQPMLKLSGCSISDEPNGCGYFEIHWYEDGRRRSQSTFRHL